jgi:hypothetical protein
MSSRPSRSSKKRALESIKELSTPKKQRASSGQGRRRGVDGKLLAKKKLDLKAGEEEQHVVAVRREEVAWPGWSVFKKVYFCGTEWEDYNKLFHREWDFMHLQAALTDETDTDESLFKSDVGSMYAFFFCPFVKTKERNLLIFFFFFFFFSYLFGLSEPTLIEDEVWPVPIIVAVQCTVPPPEKVGISSVMKSEELVKDFREMKMGWVPSWSGQDASVDKLKSAPTFHYLESRKRDAWLSVLGEAKRREFDYANPYIFLPHREQFTGKTEVSWIISINGQGKPCDYDWSMDDIDDRTDELIEENHIDAKHRQLVRDSVVEHVTVAKQLYLAARQAFRARLDAISNDDKEALRNIRILKFYPQNFEHPTSRYINRYYQQAQAVFPHNQ